jgi:hypothetical protein
LGCLFSLCFLEEQERKGPKAPNEPKVLQILFYFGLFIFSLFFGGTREKGAFAPNEQKVFQILFLFWVVYFIFVFCKNKRERIYIKEGLRPHEPKGFADSLFILGCLFSLCFLREREGRSPSFGPLQ